MIDLDIATKDLGVYYKAEEILQAQLRISAVLMSPAADPEDSPLPDSLQQNVEGSQNQIIGQTRDSIIINSAEQITIHPPQKSSAQADDIKDRPLIRRSPYLGLRKFEVKDKDLFFGRDQLIRRLQTRLEPNSFLLVLGASGSGKSSLIRAGLIPKLNETSASVFREFIFTPDRDPFDSFRSSLRSAGYPLSELDILLTHQSDSLQQVVTSLKQPDEDWFIFVDQFEELFTRCQDLQQRQAFINGMLQLLKAKLPGVNLVLAMRADFLDRLGAYPQLKGILQCAELVTDMGRDELWQAIQKPAAQHGVILEPQLTSTIIHDLRGQPDSVSDTDGAHLPLLQYTLKLLWEASGDLSDRTLRTSTYLSLGGVRGALQRHVDEIYAPLSDEQKQAAKQIFLRLVDTTSADTGTAVASKVTSRSAQVADFSATEQEILYRFVNAGLLVTDDPNTKSELIMGDRPSASHATVALAHESLIDAWDTLKGWIEENRPLIRLVNQLREDADRWYPIYQQNPEISEAELWQGSKLQHLLSQRQEMVSRFGAFKPQETEFVRACEELGDRQIRTEVERQRQQKRLFRRIATGSVAALALVMSFAGVAVWQWREAERTAILSFAQTSEARFTINRHTLDALIPALQAGERLERFGWLMGEPELHNEVMKALTQAVFWKKELNRLEGHTNFVNSVSFSRTGNVLASGSHDGTIRLWKLNGELLRSPLQGHTAPVTSVSINPDGTRLVSVGLDRTLKLWDLQTGQLLQDINPAHNDEIYAVTFDPTGQLLATAGKDQIIQLWTVQNNLVQKSSQPPFSAHKGSVRTIAFNPNRQILISGSEEGQVILWNLQGQSLREPIQVYQKGVLTAVRFNQDGTFATAGYENGRGAVKLWDTEGRLMREFPANRAGLLSVGFSPDGGRIAASDAAGVIHLWQLNGTKLATLQRLNSARSSSLSFSFNGLLAVGSNDNSVELWQVESPQLTLLAGHTQTIQGVAVGADGNIATASEDGTVRLWSPNSQQIWQTPPLEEVRFIRVVFHPQQAFIASGDTKGMIHFWDRTIGQPILPPLQAHNDLIYSIAFSPDGKVMVTTSGDRTAKIWNLSTLSQPVILPHPDAVYSASFDSTGKVLATSSADGTISFWDKAGKPLASPLQIGVGGSAIAFNPKDNLLAIGDLKGTVKLWDGTRQTFRELGQHTAAVWGVSFSPDGQLLSSASDDATVKLWETNGTLVTTLSGHIGNVNSVSFHPQDARILVSGGQDARGMRWLIGQRALKGFLLAGCQQLEDYLESHAKHPDVPRELCGSR